MHLSRLASFKVYYALVTEKKIEETNPGAMARSSLFVPFCDLAHVLWRVSCIHHGCATRATAYSLRVVSSIFYILKIVVYDTSRLGIDKICFKERFYYLLLIKTERGC